MVPQQVFFVLRGRPYLRGSLIRGSTVYDLSRKEEMPWVNGFESMTFTLFTRISSGLLEYRQTVLAIPFQLGQLSQLHGKHTKKQTLMPWFGHTRLVVLDPGPVEYVVVVEVLEGVHHL